jgi:hypothetical protein
MFLRLGRMWSPGVGAEVAVAKALNIGIMLRAFPSVEVRVAGFAGLRENVLPDFDCGSHDLTRVQVLDRCLNSFRRVLEARGGELEDFESHFVRVAVIRRTVPEVEELLPVGFELGFGDALGELAVPGFG